MNAELALLILVYTLQYLVTFYFPRQAATVGEREESREMISITLPYLTLPYLTLPYYLTTLLPYSTLGILLSYLSISFSAIFRRLLTRLLLKGCFIMESLLNHHSSMKRGQRD